MNTAEILGEAERMLRFSARLKIKNGHWKLGKQTYLMLCQSSFVPMPTLQNVMLNQSVSEPRRCIVTLFGIPVVVTDDDYRIQLVAEGET